MILSTLSSVAGKLDDDCAKFLGGRTAVETHVQNIVSNNLIAHGSFRNDIAAITGTGGTDLPDGFASIVINDSSAFFNGGFLVGNNRSQHTRIPGNTDQARAFILLHELAHSMEVAGFENDYGDNSAGARNDQKIDTNCSKTLGNFK